MGLDKGQHNTRKSVFWRYTFMGSIRSYLKIGIDKIPLNRYLFEIKSSLLSNWLFELLYTVET